MLQMTDAIEVDIVRPAALAASDVADWNRLRELQPVWQNPLMGPGFALAVGAVRPDAAVAIYRLQGRAVGFMAHHRRPGGLGRPIGAPFSDYHGLVGAPALAASGAEIVGRAGLRAFRNEGLIDPTARFGGVDEAEKGYAIHLDTTGEAYVEALRAASPKRFKNYRRLRNRLEELGPIRLQASRQRGDFQTLLSWKREQFGRTGMHDVLGPLWVQQLMDGIFAGEQWDRSEGLMLTLHAGDTLVAGHFGLREGPIFHPWIASSNPDLSASSPGQAFLHYAILAMPELGLTTYDLGTGHDHYKRPFANVTRQTLMGTTTPKGTVHRREITPFLGRVRRRLDHIAATELSLAGRMQGVISSAMAIPRRNLHRGAGATD